MLRNISVVMIRMGACGLMLTSPVRIPTSSPYSAWKSRNFWLESAFTGAVYTTRVPSAMHPLMTCSAMAVFPAPVGAETITECPSLI